MHYLASRATWRTTPGESSDPARLSPRTRIPSPHCTTGVNDHRKGLPFEFIWPEDMRNPPTAYQVFAMACLECGLHDQGKQASEEFDISHASWTAEHGGEWKKWEKANEDDRQGAEPPAEPLRPDPLPWKRFSAPIPYGHTFGVICARGGKSLLEIGDLLGHSSVVATARYAKFFHCMFTVGHRPLASAGPRLFRASPDSPELPAGSRVNNAGRQRP